MANRIGNGSMHTHHVPTVDIQRIEPLDLMGLLRSAWHGKHIIGLCIVMAVASAGYYAFWIATPQYAATTTLEINRSSAPGMDLEQALSGRSTDPAQINTEVAILRSKHLMAQVVMTLDLAADPEFNRYLIPVPQLSITGVRNRLRELLSGPSQPAPDEAAILEKTAQNLRDAISAGVQRDTYIFQITATTNTPEKSALIVDTLAQAYLADQVAGKRAETEAAVSWLSDRVYDLQLDLEAKETAINDLITKSQVQDATVFDALSRQTDDTAGRLAEAEANLAAAKADLQDSSPPHPIAPADPIAGTASHDRLSVEVSRHTNQVAALRVYQTSLNRQLADQSDGLIRLQQLRREADATRVIYETFLARLQETSIQRGLQNPDSRVLATASPGSYVAPQKILILTAAVLLGALAGIGVVFIAGTQRHGFLDVTDLGAVTGLPVMAQIPRISLRRRDQILDYLREKPCSAAAEALRGLRTSLLLADTAQTPQVILSTSSIAGEGKTTNSIALAHNLSGLGKSVLLIEADIRRSTFGQYFVHTTKAGLAEILRGEATIRQAVFTDVRLGADVIKAHPTPQNPADLFAGPALAILLAQLRKNYDFIILDAPPVLPVPDARILAQHADAVLYTVRWHSTAQHFVQAGHKALGSVNAPITGLVLAQVDERKMHRYAGASYAGYGQAYYQN